MEMKSFDEESLFRPVLGSTGKPEKTYHLRSKQLILLIAGCWAIGALMSYVVFGTRSNNTSEEFRVITRPIELEQERLNKRIDGISERLRGEDESFDAKQQELKKQIDQLNGQLGENQKLLNDLQSKHDDCAGERTRQGEELEGLVRLLNDTSLETPKNETWPEFGNCAYKLFDVKIRYSNAESTCQKFGANLASIHSQEENKFVAELIHRDRYWAWIGLHKTTPNEKWQWTDKSDGAFEAWSSNYPKDMPETSGIIGVALSKSNDQWYDDEGHNVRPFVCKRCNAA